MVAGIWGRSVMLEDRLNRHDKCYYENGVLMYQGRHVIKKDLPIDGGVCMGAGEREAIVVDSKKYSGINRLYEIAKQKATEGGKVRRNLALEAIYDTVNEAMSYDHNGVMDKYMEDRGLDRDGKVTLDVYIQNKLGVCRHMALACGVFIEKFNKDGILRGKASIDRNENGRGAHEWCRYTAHSGDTVILDVAQHKFGLLKEMPSNQRWPYERPGEQAN